MVLARLENLPSVEFFSGVPGGIMIGENTKMPILNYPNTIVQIDKGGILEVRKNLLIGKPQVKGSRIETRLKIESGENIPADVIRDKRVAKDYRMVMNGHLVSFMFIAFLRESLDWFISGIKRRF